MFSFILVPTWLLISVSVFPTVKHASLLIYQQRLLVRPSVSLTCIQHWCVINALGSMNLGLMQICTPLSPSLEIFRHQIHVHNHAREHIDCDRVCDHWAFPSIFSKRESKHVYPHTNTAYFSVISSWRLLTREYDMENVYAMPMSIFFNHWIRA